jgi:hypothetical protein
VGKRWLLAGAVSLAVGASASLAVQGSRATVTPGVAHTWRTVDGALVGLEDLPYSRRIHSVFELKGDGSGEKAYLSVSWTERRFATKRAASCGGLRYLGRYVVDTRGNAGDAWFGLANRVGTAHLKFTRRLSVFRTKNLVGPPLCVESRGTWSGSTGVLGGFAGTFLFNHDATLVLR